MQASEMEMDEIKILEQMYPDDVFGADGLNDKQRRLTFINRCCQLGIKTEIGQSNNRPDSPNLLNLRIWIPNRSGLISAIFSHHSICACVVETATSVTDDEVEFLKAGGMEDKHEFSDSNIQHWKTLNELIDFVRLLKEYYATDDESKTTY
jgi:hypothetical protein